MFFGSGYLFQNIRTLFFDRFNTRFQLQLLQVELYGIYYANFFTGLQ